MFLNGRQQYNDHLMGRHHRRNMAKQQEHAASAPSQRLVGAGSNTVVQDPLDRDMGEEWDRRLQLCSESPERP